MFNHCSLDFKPYEIWYLYDIKGFIDRQLKLGKCPDCKKDVVELIETRISDNKVFAQSWDGKPAIKVAEQNKCRVNYSSLDRKVKKCKVSMPKTLRYGVNKSVKVGKMLKFRQRAVDFYGNTELLKEVAL